MFAFSLPFYYLFSVCFLFFFCYSSVCALLSSFGLFEQLLAIQFTYGVFDYALTYTPPHTYIYVCMYQCFLQALQYTNLTFQSLLEISVLLLQVECINFTIIYPPLCKIAFCIIFTYTEIRSDNIDFFFFQHLNIFKRTQKGRIVYYVFPDIYHFSCFAFILGTLSSFWYNFCSR